MTERHINKYSTSLVIREMDIPKNVTMHSVGEDVGKRAFAYPDCLSLLGTKGFPRKRDFPC